ncbi:hypothetical protein N7456_010991 [Penicillium angulare]|uniref:Zn(2)-C6 fungal-type domain-containing protein n=1 Tax=Penicillium angulare TaxID=116970 RepID=A0A9W9JZM4_9EURO|nr:hypothetical protein N7456_010991 [Penicillium angulare]
MSSRLAACEACRRAKLACDHKRPACTRCENNNRAGICIYRVSPFKRKRASEIVSPEISIADGRAPETPPSSTFSPRPNPYPNPGYFGSSSHATIFDQIPVDQNSSLDGHNDSTEVLSSTPCPQMADEILLLQGANTLRLLLNEHQLPILEDFVLFWLAKGANLALAEPFVEACTKKVVEFFTSLSQDGNWHLTCARLLLQNSAKSLNYHAETTASKFSSQFLHANFRWEALGIFFLAVSRATIDINFFPRLYMTREQRSNLRKQSTKLSDYALEITLSLDCLNDIQLVLQYENFIMHSFVDGDHSYKSWRKMGDVISSIFAMGYHDNLDAKPDTPFFLVQLRKTLFARIFSADKNIAIFLGRPPRLTKRFSNFQLPSSFSGPQQNIYLWNPDASASYTSETRWSALCASLKEEILELARDKDNEKISQRISSIQLQAESQWDALPPQFKIEGGFKDDERYSPFQKDFLISTRLNHLHVLFLLRLLMPNTLAAPDTLIVEIAGEMLSLVVDVILIRDQTVNSGTSLKWKIAHYGLPAVAMMVIAIINKRNTPMPVGMSKAKVLQDMSLYVAEIQRGGIVLKEDPIYVLLSRATETVQKLLDSFYSGNNQVESEPDYANEIESTDWATVLGQDLWEFETEFWQNLANHPSLGTIDENPTGL